MKIKIFVLSFLFLSACQQKPTVGVTDSGVLVQNKDYRKVVQSDSIVFDTRSPFEFNSHKIPGSINLPVSDFQASQDLMDAARRLSLYGVAPVTPVVIVGNGQGDEAKLAWEFAKLGVLKVETLKISVFRTLNLQPEALKQNVTIWKPSSPYSELSAKEFKKKMESLRTRFNTKARSASFQGFPVGEATRTRVLFLTDEEWKGHSEYPFVDHGRVTSAPLFDDKGLLEREMKLSFEFTNAELKKYDFVFLLDRSPQRWARAYALTQLGVKSLDLVAFK